MVINDKLDELKKRREHVLIKKAVFKGVHDYTKYLHTIGKNKEALRIAQEQYKLHCYNAPACVMAKWYNINISNYTGITLETFEGVK